MREILCEDARLSGFAIRFTEQGSKILLKYNKTHPTSIPSLVPRGPFYHALKLPRLCEIGGIYIRKHIPARVSYRDEFLISYRVYMMTCTCHFISRYL